MFEQLLTFSSSFKNMGIICSVQGGHYLAVHMNPSGEVIQHAGQPFRSLVQARTWLQKQGIQCISLRQSPAYFEMIGHPH